MLYINIKSFRKDYETLAKRLCIINGYDKAYHIADETKGAIVVGYCEQDALDNLINEGGFNRNLMNEVDHLEYKGNGWEDSYIYAGNACEPFFSENLHIERII